MIGSKQPLQFDRQRIDQFLSQPQIKAVLEQYRINSAESLFWYYGLSRAEMVATTSDVPPNSDTNILSEVRLSNLIRLPKGRENPYNFLREHFSMDLLPYINNDIALLKDKARYDIEWNNEFLYTRDIDQLEKVAPQDAWHLRYELAFWRFNYEDAFAIYQQYDDFPYQTHALHAIALVNLNKRDEAFATIDKITDPRERRIARARLLYHLRQFEELAGLEPQSPEESAWQVLAVARKDLLKAGARLAEISGQVDLALPHLQLLSMYFGATGRPYKAQYWSRQYLQKLDKRLELWNNVVEAAIKRNDLLTAEFVTGAMAELDPDYERIDILRHKLARLKSGQEQIAQNDQR